MRIRLGRRVAATVASLALAGGVLFGAAGTATATPAHSATADVQASQVTPQACWQGWHPARWAWGWHNAWWGQGWHDGWWSNGIWHSGYWGWGWYPGYWGWGWYGGFWGWGCD